MKKAKISVFSFNKPRQIDPTLAIITRDMSMLLLGPLFASLPSRCKLTQHFIILLTLLGTTAFAQTEGDILTEQFNRILSSPSVANITSNIEEIYAVKCNLPKAEEDLKWTCLRNSSCLYRMPIKCDSKKPTHLDLLITGFDNGKTNQIKSVQITGPN